MSAFARRATLVALVVIASCPIAARAQEAVPATLPEIESDLDSRLAALVERFEAGLEQHHVPGAAIAVVKDDEVVLLRGFGYADLESKRPVTPETIFAIGSSTKAFTATTIGMLVDDGIMAWDDPVAKHLPGFELNVDTDGAPITIRDLLCHRTGFTRMSVLWAGGTISREEIIAAAATAEPWADYHERFLYNNVMFLAAGMASARAAESTWDDLVAARLLGPLGMGDSSTRVSEAQQDERLATGYVWDEGRDEFVHLPMRTLDAIAPAGAINSNVRDMAQWVRFQLADGVIDGTRLIDEATLAETRTPQMEIGGGSSYGLGWMLHERNGNPLVEHGGNIDGFAAQVALMPADGLGFVLLTNASVTAMQQLSMSMVYDAIIEEQTQEAEIATDDIDFDDFTGTYVANIGQAFKDADFEVLVQNGNLAVDVPGQMIYEMKLPDEDGKWVFAMTDQIAVSFDRGDSGDVYSMTMYQAGMQFEMPRKGVEMPIEVPLADLQPYLGRYEGPEAMTVTVRVRNNRLAVDVPGQMVFELAPPDDDGVWPIRVRPEHLQCRFNLADDGSVESMSFFEGGVEAIMTRLAAADDEGPSDTLPTVDELLALVSNAYGSTELDSLGAIRMSGTATFVHQGAKGTFTGVADGYVRYRADIRLGRLGWISSAVSEDGAWGESSFSPFETLVGRRLEHARRSHLLRTHGDWRAQFDTITVVEVAEVDGERAYVVRLEHGDLPSRRVFVATETGLVIQEDSVEMAMAGALEVPTRYRYDDFRQVDGITLPHRIWTENEFNGRFVMQIEEVETNVEVAPDLFAPPEEHRD